MSSNFVSVTGVSHLQSHNHYCLQVCLPHVQRMPQMIINNLLRLLEGAGCRACSAGIHQQEQTHLVVFVNGLLMVVLQVYLSLALDACNVLYLGYELYVFMVHYLVCQKMGMLANKICLLLGRRKRKQMFAY